MDLAALAAAKRSMAGGGFATRLTVLDGSVASGYPDPVTFVVAAQNRARMLWGALISGIPLAGAFSRQGLNPVVLIVFGGLAALISGLFLAYGRNRAILDPTGISNRWLLRRERRYAWSEVAELQDLSGPRTRAIRVVPVHGKPFMLAAPLDSPPGAPDPQYDQKAAVIAQYWRDARRGHPHRHDSHPQRGRDGRPSKPFPHHGQ